MTGTWDPKGSGGPSLGSWDPRGSGGPSLGQAVSGWRHCLAHSHAEHASCRGLGHQHQARGELENTFPAPSHGDFSAWHGIRLLWLRICAQEVAAVWQRSFEPSGAAALLPLPLNARSAKAQSRDQRRGRVTVTGQQVPARLCQLPWPESPRERPAQPSTLCLGSWGEARPGF